MYFVSDANKLKFETESAKCAFVVITDLVIPGSTSVATGVPSESLQTGITPVELVFHSLSPTFLKKTVSIVMERLAVVVLLTLSDVILVPEEFLNVIPGWYFISTRESAPRETHHVRADHAHRAIRHVAQHERRRILADLRHAADHGMAADRAELVRRCATADDRPILDMHIARKLHGIRADHMVAENHAVRGMAVRHEEAVRTDDGLLAVLRAKVHRGEFADDRTVADLHVRDGALLILEILRLHPDKGIGKDLTVRTDGRVPVKDRTLSDGRAFADLHVRSDGDVRPNLHAFTELCILVHHCGGMYFNVHVSFQFRV